MAMVSGVLNSNTILFLPVWFIPLSGRVTTGLGYTLADSSWAGSSSSRIPAICPVMPVKYYYYYYYYYYYPVGIWNKASLCFRG
jgi:hypothetical protein